MNRFIQIAAEHIGRTDKRLSDVAFGDPVEDQIDHLAAVPGINAEGAVPAAIR